MNLKTDHRFNYHIHSYLALTDLFIECLAYRNVRQLSYRTIRQELDKQLTVMILLQVFSKYFKFILPYASTVILLIIPEIMSHPIVAASIQFLNTIIYYLYYAASRN
jgi:hypothetical protein